MKIKTKLTLGVGLLFLFIILLSVLGAKYSYDLKKDTENILVANYNSLDYAKNMLVALQNDTENSIEIFETNLNNQELNITEVGEKETTSYIRENFDRYRLNTNDTFAIEEIHKGVFKLMEMNMQAIERKSEVAKSTASKAVFWIPIAGTLCFLIAFILVVNLPANIANPIKELTDSIKQISEKNYNERVNFIGHNEFGQLAKSFNTMAEKLEEYENSNLAKLMMEKERIEAIINHMHDPVIGLDEKLNIIFANEEALKIIGISRDEFIGHSAKKIGTTNDLVKSLIQDLQTIESASFAKSKPIKIYNKNREGYFEKDVLHIAITPTGEEYDKLIGHVIVLRNVTEYKELDFAKTNFIATVSHEFKTPISSIKMSLQLLENENIGKLNEEQKNLIDSIKDDATRLLKITGELLNMTQVESGNIQLSILPTDPKEILTYAIHANQTQADNKQIKFEVECSNDIPRVQADNEKTAWVLTNLISNAIRYSHEDSIIFVKIFQENNRVIISVRDTGQGIAPQYKDKIFDRYFRVPGTKKEGTGLGLAISKEFIEAQNGEIKVESDLGVGSTFSVVLNTV